LLESGGVCRPILLFRWPVVGPHSFMVRSCGDDMTMLNFNRGSSSDGRLLRATQRALIACLSGQRRRAHCAHLCARAACHPDCGTFVLALPSRVHAVLCSGRHAFTARIIGTCGTFLSSGTFHGISVAGARSFDRVKVCGIRTLLPAAVPIS
jgi:hypothetical protein